MQVQPQYANFPQTVDGMPVQVPGMPGQVDPMGDGPLGAPPGQEGPMDPDALDEEGVPPTDEADAEADGQDDGGETSGHDDTGNPFAKKTYRTHRGAVLDEDEFVRHVAILASRDPQTTAARVRESRTR